MQEPPFPPEAIDWGLIRDERSLSPRQLEALQLLYVGHPRKRIAGEMGLKPSTVDDHLDRAYGKIGERRRDRVLLAIVRLGLKRDWLEREGRRSEDDEPEDDGGPPGDECPADDGG